MALVVGIFAKETMRVSADNVRAGSLRLDVYTKLSTHSGAPSVFDTFFKAVPLLIDYCSVLCAWNLVGSNVADILNMLRSWHGEALSDQPQTCVQELCRP